MKPITIVGGGLAGLTLGVGLRQRSVPVTIYEASHYPRHRVCGEFISGDGRAVLQQLGLEQKLQCRGATLATSAAFFSGASNIQHRLPKPALCISRFKLDALLSDEFEQCGGILKTNSRWTIGFDEGVVRATGRRIQSPSTGTRWFGLKCHARNVSLDADLEMHVTENGYVGICKLSEGEVNICGLFRSNVAVPDLARAWQRWLQGSEGSALNTRLEHAALDETTFCSTAALSLQPQQAIQHEECCVGDAITMIAPATGNGMSMAFESAALAIEPLARFSGGDCDWVDTRRQIASACDQKFARRLKWAARLQYLLMSQPRCAIALGKFSPLWRLFFNATR
jgi:2-polyprenyl-6-methoxyphenol hydroxylase-like FAD-dependent oxidoreductase